MPGATQPPGVPTRLVGVRGCFSCGPVCGVMSCFRILTCIIIIIIAYRTSSLWLESSLSHHGCLKGMPQRPPPSMPQRPPPGLQPPKVSVKSYRKPYDRPLFFSGCKGPQWSGLRTAVAHCRWTTRSTRGSSRKRRRLTAYGWTCLIGTGSGGRGGGGGGGAGGRGVR